jgi:histidinol-phosphate aminotransferase
MQTNVNMIKKERNLLREEIQRLSFVSEILGSQNANFILARVVDDQGKANNDRAHFIYQTLAEIEGVVVRFRGMEMHCEGCLRITVGTRSENEILLKKLKSFETRVWAS